MKKYVLVVALMLVAMAAGTSEAEGPSGFAEFPWGAVRADVVDKLVKARCKWSVTIPKLGEDTFACYDYQLEGIGPVIVDLSFLDNGLQAYTIMAPGDRLPAFRAWISKELGQPSEVLQFTGELAVWEWPSGAAAVFRQHCMRRTESCLSLSAPGAKRDVGRPTIHRSGR